MAEQEKFSMRIEIRITDSDKKMITEKAKASGLSVSEFVRRRALTNGAVSVIETDIETLKEIYTVSRKCGGLLNQVCRELNTNHNLLELEPRLKSTMFAVATVSNSISDFIADVRKSA